MDMWIARTGKMSTMLALLTLEPRHLQSGADAWIDDRVSCTRCQTVQRVTATLRITDDEGSVPFRIREDGRERYWVFREAAVPLVFPARGGQGTSLGRRGEGPAEFTRPYDGVSVTGDSFVVFDAGLRRATVVDSELKAVRFLQMTTPPSSPVVVSWPDRVLVSASIRTVAEAGMPIHVFSFRGSEVQRRMSFGGEGELRPESSSAVSLLSEVQAGGIWSAAPGAYRLVRLSTTGKIERAVSRRSQLFDFTDPGYIDPNKPPPVRIADIHQDSTGLLWVYLRVPAPTWKESITMPPPGVREVSSRQIDRVKRYHTILEIVDPKANSVVTRVTIPKYFVGALPRRRAAFYLESPDGEGVLQVESFLLQGLDRR
jgi:hypothetical protein